ncbi:MAG TPA: addiction module protein [Pirellulales bacterium]|jgi:putative addiction module component (TIGR02574 family)
MTVSHKDIDYTQLSPAERILLAQELWDSVIAAKRAPATTPEQRAEVERRMTLADLGQMPSRPWADIRAAKPPKE